jgi:hypothetical protein
VQLKRHGFHPLDPFSKRVVPIKEKITFIEAETSEVAGPVDLGADLEAAV